MTQGWESSLSTGCNYRPFCAFSLCLMVTGERGVRVSTGLGPAGNATRQRLLRTSLRPDAIQQSRLRMRTGARSPATSGWPVDGTWRKGSPTSNFLKYNINVQLCVIAMSSMDRPAACGVVTERLILLSCKYCERI